MSLISVDTEALKDIEKRFGTLSKKLGQTESSLKSIRSNLDSDIKKRNGIDSKLQNLIKELDEEETVLDQVIQFLSKTIKQYQDIEKSMQNKVNEINGDTKTKTNIFSKILDAAISSLRKKVEIIQKIISLPVIIGSTIIGNTVIKGIRDILSKEGNEVTNKPVEEEKEKTEISPIPPLSGVLSYNPNVYSEEVLMLQRRLNEIYAGVSGYKKIKEDGYFGPETLAAVNRYKEEHGLWNFGEYAGKVGETTWNHMFSLKIEGNGTNTTGGQTNNPAPVSSTGTIGITTAAARQKIVDEAKYWIGKGVKYQFGSPHYNNEDPVKRILDHNNPPPSLDCSDFTAGVYATALGISFNDYTGSQLKVGTAVDVTKAKTGDFSDLQPGDLIILDWVYNGPDSDGEHAVLYIGDGKFIHCSSSAKGIVEAKLDANWGKDYGYVYSNILGIRRIIQDDDSYINNPSDGKKLLPG